MAALDPSRFNSALAGQSELAHFVDGHCDPTPGQNQTTLLLNESVAGDRLNLEAST